MLIDGKQIRLTEDWAPGSHKITVAQFESTIASGTPPLVVASNTRVPNLNADLLDSVEASEFPLLAGRAGGQTLIGGTASGDDLTFSTTSNASKGSYIFSEMNAGSGVSPGCLFNDTNGVVQGGGAITDLVDVTATSGTGSTVVFTGGDFDTLTDNSMADTLHRHSELSASDGSPDQVVVVQPGGNVLISGGNLGVGAVDSSRELNVEGSGNLNIAIKTTGATRTVNMIFDTPTNDWDIGATGAGALFAIRDRTDSFARVIIIEKGAGDDRLRIDAAGNVGIGENEPLAKLHVDQADTSLAKPVLYLDQADISEEMIQFATTIGTGNPIEAVGAKSLTITHFIKTTIPGGLTRYFGVGTIA